MVTVEVRFAGACLHHQSRTSGANPIRRALSTRSIATRSSCRATQAEATMTMAMPSRGRHMVNLMVTPTTRMNMPRVITTTKDTVMVITTKGMAIQDRTIWVMEGLTARTVMATTERMVATAPTPPMQMVHTTQMPATDTLTEDITRPDTKISTTAAPPELEVIRTTTRGKDNHEAVVGMILRRIRRPSAISQ